MVVSIQLTKKKNVLEASLEFFITDAIPEDYKSVLVFIKNGNK
jgi:hypothetical protein